MKGGIAYLKCDPFPMRRVHGLHDGNSVLEFSTPAEELAVKGHVRGKLWEGKK
jgi:hypothetical protein